MNVKELVRMIQIPPTGSRVEKRTRRKINEAIKEKTIYYIGVYKNACYDDLTLRLDELNREWDTEKVIELGDAVLITGLSVLGLRYRKPGLFALSGVIGLFLASHALEGWCVMQEAVRALGVRTPSEICIEKIAVKYLRGDFEKKTGEPPEIYNLASGGCR